MIKKYLEFINENKVKHWLYHGSSHKFDIFDFDKLNWVNSNYIRKLPLEKLIEITEPYLKTAYVNIEPEKTRKIIQLEQERLKQLTDIVALTDYFFRDEILSYSMNG